MSIALKFVVMGLAAAGVLAFIWWRSRSRSTWRTRRPSGQAGKGLTDEMAAAVEDVTAEFQRRERSNHKKSDTPPRGRDVSHR